MSTAEHDADDGARDQVGTGCRLLWLAVLVAVHAPGVPALHLATTWLQAPPFVAY